MVKLFDVEFDPVSTDLELIALQNKHKDKYDPAYICQSVIKRRQAAKEWIESLWLQYKQYADINFCSSFKKHFTPRSWELYLGSTLLNRGYRLENHHSHCPDIKLKYNQMNKEQIVWIEATIASRGTTEDCVPAIKPGVGGCVPIEQMTIRLANALNGKYQAYTRYIKDHIVNIDDICVIAINSSDFGHPTGWQYPLILKNLFGIGELVMTFPIDRESATEPCSHWSTIDDIKKMNGSPVPTNFFIDPTHSNISAIIYCDDNILNSPTDPEKMGENFIIVHNPLAKNLLPLNFFKFGEEWAVVGNEIKKL